MSHLVETEGWRGLARGTTGTLAREVPGNALFFTVYEVSRRPLRAVPSVAAVALAAGRQALR